VVICSWCKKVKVPDLGFVEIEEAVRTLDLFGEPLLPRLTHGSCEPCTRKMREELGLR
jgi:hypothetical protein